MNANDTSYCRPVLERVEPFAELGPDDRRALESHARVLDVPKDEWLYMEGAPREHVYCLVEGTVKVSRLSRSGKEFILELVGPDDVFGESALFEDGPHDSFAVAIEDSCAVTLPRLEVERLLRRRPELLLRFAKLLEERRRRVEGRLVTLAFQKVRGRVASLLLQLCDDYGVRGRDGISLRINLRHQELANLIGASREIVTHTLSDFRREGLIETNGGTLVVRETVPLERL